MAVVVKAMPERWDGMRKSKYPLEKWFDGRVWKLKPGEDFDSHLSTARTSLSTLAERRDLRLETRKFEGHLYIQAFPIEETE